SRCGRPTSATPDVTHQTRVVLVHMARVAEIACGRLCQSCNLAAGCKTVFSGRERNRREPVAMGAELLDHGAALHVPDSDRPIGHATGRERSLMRECDPLRPSALLAGC